MKPLLWLKQIRFLKLLSINKWTLVSNIKHTFSIFNTYLREFEYALFVVFQHGQNEKYIELNWWRTIISDFKDLSNFYIFGLRPQKIFPVWSRHSENNVKNFTLLSISRDIKSRVKSKVLYLGLYLKLSS